MSGKACVCLSEASAQNFFLLFPNGECVCWGGFIFDPKNNLQSIFGGYFSDFGKKLPHNLPNRASGDKGNNAWHKLYNLCLIIYNNGTNINNLSLNGFCPENYIILHQ